MVYVPVSKPVGTVQGRENAPLDVIGVCNDATSSSLSLVILISRRLASDCPIPLIIMMSPMQIAFPQFVMLNSSLLV